METIRLLIIEDDTMAAELIRQYLSELGFAVTVVDTVSDGLAAVKYNAIDLVLLDINLPDFDGYEFLKDIKNRISLPIIVTSANSDTKSKVLAFKYGASDYMTKPIDLEELEARIWVHLAKHSEIKTQEERELFRIEGNTIVFQSKPLALTTIEFDILSLLVKNKNATLTREELLSHLSTLSSPRSLDNHIKNIRKKIGDNGSSAKYLKTEYGVGYRLINTL